jgi:hypothetical protein
MQPNPAQRNAISSGPIDPWSMSSATASLTLIHSLKIGHHTLSLPLKQSSPSHFPMMHNQQQGVLSSDLKIDLGCSRNTHTDIDHHEWRHECLHDGSSYLVCLPATWMTVPLHAPSQESTDHERHVWFRLHIYLVTANLSPVFGNISIQI